MPLVALVVLVICRMAVLVERLSTVTPAEQVKVLTVLVVLAIRRVSVKVIVLLVTLGVVVLVQHMVATLPVAVVPVH